MSAIFEFINKNDGTLIAILTFIMVIINVLLWLTNNNQLKQIKKQWKESQNPHLSACIAGIMRDIYIKISNVGGSSAVQVKVLFDNHISTYQNSDPVCKENEMFLEQLAIHGVDIINGTSIYVPTFSDYKTLEDRTVKIKVNYKNTQGDTFESDFSLQVNGYQKIKYQSHEEKMDSEALSNIADQLKQLVKIRSGNNSGI